jgi:ClpP class serine protease
MYAMSGGTLLALSGTGHEIYMAPTACLGPVDPQLGNLFKYGSAESWNKIVKMKGKKAEDSTISFAFIGKQYTKTIYNTITNLLKNDKLSLQQSQKFAKYLTDGKIEHALPLTPSLLKGWGLDVKYLEPRLTGKLIKMLDSDIYEGVHHK